MSSATTARQRLLATLPVDRASRAISDISSAKVSARAHEVTRPSRARKLARDWGSGNTIVGMDAKQLRDQARHLERDLDLARNAINILVQNTVGSGIDVLSAPRQPGGEIDRVLAQDIDDLWDDWWDKPEVTGKHDFGRCQQLLSRGMFRDGESFYQDLIGPVPGLTYDTQVRFAIEMLEADLIPLDLTDPGKKILQGCERNDWGRTLAWHVYKSHPGDVFGFNLETKRVSADRLHQVALIDRMHQMRGLSVLASSMSRFEDVKDYEESERIAAKVAASMCAFIKKGDSGGSGTPVSGELIVGADGDQVRELRMTPGAIFDELLPGEDVGMISSNRPNPNAATWRKEQLRAAAGGVGVSYSSLSLDYNGTYSAQRQELVEKWGTYLMLAESFIAQCVRPIRRRFIEAIVLDGLIQLPRGWEMRHLMASTYVRPMMPWIDPLKEAMARGEYEDRGWASPQQNALALGNNPNEVLNQTADWHKQRTALGIVDGTALPSDPNSRAAVRAAVVRSTLMEKS
ncbi:phage portal protein [Stenotrophomonas maltophilia]|uniref:phage portal protein n=1 Tax=Stenotrophomonas maltophilia TaxID=40324 RepID=UPI002ACCAF6E|nr:phage portal protein [Stenotrophomonas maltophilia]MDZ5815090.1 phage portal protein [Stenotrophomonas maltophilia]